MDQQDQVDRTGQSAIVSLPSLDGSSPHTFIKPVKRINEGDDIPRFLSSGAYVDIGKFVMLLNLSMCPQRTHTNGTEKIGIWQMGDPDIFESESIQILREMLEKISSITTKVPPDTGPRRFGNISFRKWHEVLKSRVMGLLEESIPADVLNFKCTGEITACDELSTYLLGSFGSPQRLDYGTGHELSFLAFLGCIWKLGGFQSDGPSQDNTRTGRNIVLGIIEPYLGVVRQLILTYTLEPAGSHGVWGLDDHFFLPYIFGSAQYCPAIRANDSMPVEGSLPNAPNPGDVTKKSAVERERGVNMYFSAIGFIYDVKSGAFWEHSPMLFDISGVRSGWGKINKGMIKMYNAEVLSKFPVVQHFPFGSLFKWEEDPSVATPSVSSGSSSQSPVQAIPKNEASVFARPQVQPHEGTRAPWSR